MATNVMKRAAENMRAAQEAARMEAATAPPPPPPPPPPEPARRSELLKNVNVERWLREQLKAHKNDKATNDATKSEYRKISITLEMTRVEPWEPVDIEKKAGAKTTFYKYRAAVRFSALERAQVALRARDSKGASETEKKAAYAVMLTAAADLARYPADAQPGFKPAAPALTAERASKAGFSAVANALGEAIELPKLPAQHGKTASEFTKKSAPTDTNAKLKDAQKIQKIDGWRGLLFAELVKREGKWIDHAAVAALTGCRPAEVTSVHIERVGNALVISIPGAKVSETKGQPHRKFTITADSNGPEFDYLLGRVKDAPLLLGVPVGVTRPASTFSEALKSAGEKVFTKNTPPMTGYVYRHAIACDMKADGAEMDHIAASMGHAVTKTQSYYGRASGGKKGSRVFSIEADREIKQTHGTSGFKRKTPGMSAGVVAFQSPSFGSPGL